MIQTRLSRQPNQAAPTSEPPSERPELSDTVKPTLLAPREPAVSLSPRSALMNAEHRISIFDLHAYYGAEEAVKGSASTW
jgi:hypothetical protein